MDILNKKRKKKKIFSEEEDNNDDSENIIHEINNETILEDQQNLYDNKVIENKKIIINEHENNKNLLNEDMIEKNKDSKIASDNEDYKNSNFENNEDQNNTEDQYNKDENNVKKKKKRLKKKGSFQKNYLGDSKHLMEDQGKEYKFNKKNFILKNNDEFHRKKKIKKKIDIQLESHDTVSEKHDKKVREEVYEEDKDQDKNHKGEQHYDDENQEQNNKLDSDFEKREEKKKKKFSNNNGNNNDLGEMHEEMNQTEKKTNLKEKKKRIKNSKLMDNINPDEDKLKLKLIQISFTKKEYNIEEYIYECLKILVPLNKHETFLSNENIIFEQINNEDLKKLEVMWFNKLTKNRQKNLTTCFTTLNKLSKENDNDKTNLNKEENVNNENNMSVNDEEKNNSLENSIFYKNKEVIIVDYLVELCNQQIKLIKEYISYVKKNIYDLSSIKENNDKIKEMKIIAPMKRREFFFYLNICISINYVQETAPNVYSVSSTANPDIRGFNLHPMFFHINKKNEQKKENITNPWEKLKLLKKGKKNDIINKNEKVNRKKYSIHEDETGEKENEAMEEETYLKEMEEKKKMEFEEAERKRKALEEMEKKKKALEEIEKKKKQKADKKTLNVYSLLESAAQFFGEGPKYSNPNVQEFHKSNNNQLVYIKPPDSIDEKNILINFFLQFPSINKKLEYNKRRIYAENYGLIKIIKNDENLPINFELNTQPWELKEYEDLWHEQNKLNNFHIWDMSNVLNDDDMLEHNHFSNTKTEPVNQTENSKSDMSKIEHTKNEADENEIIKNEADENEIIKNEADENEIIKNEADENEIIKNEADENEIIKNEIKGTEINPNEKSQSQKIPITIDDINKKINMMNENTITNNNEMKKIGIKKKSETITNKIKKKLSNNDSKQPKLISFLNKSKINKGSELENKDEMKIREDKREEISNKLLINNENEEIEYITIKKKKKKVLDDTYIFNERDNNNNLNGNKNVADENIKNSMSDKMNENQDNENENKVESEEEKKIFEELIKKEKKKRLLNDKMKEIFELEAEESEDENIEDPEERKKAKLLKNQKNEENDNEEEDEEYNSEDFKAFINNEEYNSDDEIVKLKHAKEMEKLEEDIFLKKFTYQGKEFNKELTNKEKLELEREKQLLKKRKLLLNCNIENVKLSDFESDSSSSSSSNKHFRNSKYESYSEFENNEIKKKKDSLDYSYNDTIFKKGEYINNIMDEKKTEQILRKIDDVIYKKEVNTDEGKKIVIKKKRKIRFHQDLSDVTVTEEEKLDEYEKAKKKQKRLNNNMIEEKSRSLNISSKSIAHRNKASIKWNNNIKDISEFDTPTNGEIFKGFRKVENVQ